MELVIVMDKSPGPTSFDMVREVKPLFPGEKAGHGGSLDPFASGVLIILVGRATRLSGALLNADKVYRARVKLGQATDTMDRTGNVTMESEVPVHDLQSVSRTVKSFEGIWWQTPPMFSAKKIRGVRFYELARQNISVRRQPIPVNLYRIDCLGLTLPYVDFEVHCSKGTYVRVLADEIGKKLGSVGHLYELRRLSCGTFTLSESITLTELTRDPAGSTRKGYDNFLRLLRDETCLPLWAKEHPTARHRLPLEREDGKSLANLT